MSLPKRGRAAIASLAVLLLLSPTVLAFPAQADVLLDQAGKAIGPSMPKQGGLVLLGHGQAYTQRSGVGQRCEGDSLFALQASYKPFGFEPTVTLVYGGSTSSDQRLSWPCAEGQLAQHFIAEIHGPFSGAWYASRHIGNTSWLLQVSAPSQGQRDVSWVVSGPNGVEDSFLGRVTEW